MMVPPGRKYIPARLATVNIQGIKILKFSGIPGIPVPRSKNDVGKKKEEKMGEWSWSCKIIAKYWELYYYTHLLI